MSTPAQIVHSVGNRIESMVASAKNEVVIHSSQKEAFVLGARQVEPLLAFVDAEVEKGVFDLETAKHVKRYVQRAVIILESLGKRAENSALEATGRIRGIEDCVGVTKKIYDAHVAEEARDREEAAGLAAAAEAVASQKAEPQPKKKRSRS